MACSTLQGLPIERMDRASLVNFQSRESTVDEVPRLGDPQAAISTLIAVYGDHSEVFGVLHPEPAYRLKIDCFSQVPFIRLSRWPITDGRITTEWVISHPDGFNAGHWPIRAT